MLSMLKEAVSLLILLNTPGSEQDLLTPAEKRDGQIEGLVPVLMLNFGLDCATAMQWSFQLAQVQVKGIRAIESSLAKDHDEKDAVSKLLKDVFLEGCKDVAMGLIHWRSVHTPVNF